MAQDQVSTGHEIIININNEQEHRNGNNLQKTSLMTVFFFIQYINLPLPYKLQNPQKGGVLDETGNMFWTRMI